MKQRVALALLTVLVVAAGFFVGRWTERNGCRVPPPPSALLSELSSKDAKPALILAYGERDRIVLASHGGFFGMDLQNMVGMPFGLQGLFKGDNGKRN